MSKLDFVLADTTHIAMLKTLDIVIEQSQQDKFGTFVVLVPDSKTILAEKYLLQKHPKGAFSNIYIYSLKRLLSKISPVNNKLVLSKTAGIMIIKKIVMENLENLVCFKKTATTNGFAEIIFGTISQLKSSGVSVSDFYDMIDSVDASLKIKMQDIAFLFDQYQQYIENHYIDQSDLYSVLETSVEKSQFIKDSHMFFVGFESVTSEALNVCKQLISFAKSFVVACPYMPMSANSHISDNEVFTKFKHIADQKQYAYQPQRIRHNFLPDFAHIKDNLYAYPAKKKFGTSCVEIGSAADNSGEIDWVAQKISKLIKQGARYKDIALVISGLENYQEKITEIFSSYDFSFYISQPYDYSMHPLFKLIKSYIDVCRKNFDKSACIEFLSNILINDTPYLDDFINYVNQYGINHNKFAKQFTSFDEKILSKEQFCGVENLRAFLTDCVKMFNAEKSTAAAYTKQIKQLLEKLNITQKLQDLQNLQQSDMVSASVTSQVQTKLENIFEQLETFLGDQEMSLETFQNILLSGLAVTDVSVIPISQDCITISSNQDGLLDIDYLFILNVTEGNFPAKQQDCGIILDSEIAKLNGKSSKTIEPTIKTINRRERYKAYETLLLANKKIYLSFNNGSGENMLKESNIINQLVEMFGGTDELPIQKYSSEFIFSNDNLTDEISNQICSKEKAIKYVCKQIGNKRTFGAFDNIKLVNAAYAASKPFMADNLNFALNNLNRKEEYKISNASKLYFSNNKTSTSQLEQYFDCPFLFFTRYGVRLKENLTSKLKAMDVGNILHKVAEVFVKKFSQNPNIDCQKTAQNITKQIISSQYVADDNKFLVKIVATEAERLCEKLQNEMLHSFFKPAMLEKSFGADGNFGAVKLGNVVLEGKIDRVDVFEKHFRIIDYKTGKIEDNIKKVYYGKKIQLVTYLLAMQNSGLQPAGVVYFPIRNEFATDSKKTGRMKGFFLRDGSIIRKMDTTLNEEKRESDVLDIKFNKPQKGELNLRNSANLLSGEQFEDLCQYVQKMCSQAVSEILDGYIMPSPIRMTESDKLHCENCEFSGVCGVEKTQYSTGRKCYGDVKIEQITNLRGKDGQ